MSALVYNGVNILMMKSASVEFDTKRDKVSGLDVLCNTATIRGRGIVSIEEDTIPTNSTATLSEIKHMLNMPRRALTYTVNGISLISWNPSTEGAPDADNGPTPVQPATVREITPGTFFVEFGYRVSTYDCDETNPANIVTSIRWTQSESFSETWFSRITTRGTLTVRADLLTNADNFRNLATPIPLNDYVRVQSEYTLNPSGTELDFVFVDEEKDRLPPRVALKASGRFTVNVQQPGVKRMGTVELSLEGRKGSSRRELLLTAVSMAYAKLQSEKFEDGVPLVWGTFSEDLFEPKVSIAMTGMLRAIEIGVPVMGSVGTMPLIDRGEREGIAPPLRSRLSALVASVFRDPCAITSEGLATTGEKPVLTAASAVVSAGAGIVSGIVAGATATFAIGATGIGRLAAAAGRLFTDLAPYDEYKITSEWVHDTGTRMLPGTGVGSAAKVGKPVSVHGGKMTLEVNWTAKRSGSPPVLPTFQSLDQNIVPLKASVLPAQPEPTADGGMLTYRVSGHYIYAVVDPDQASVFAPMPPFLSDLVTAASSTAAASYSDQILWRSIGSQGSSPFTDGRFQLAPVGGQQQDPVTAAIAGGTAGGVLPGANDNGPPDGGLQSGGGAIGGLLGGSGVNA